MSCNASCLDIGCFGNCGVIPLGFNATQTGVHTVVYKWDGQINEQDFEATTGEALEIPNVFNDNGYSKFQVRMPNGEWFIATSDAMDYDCFRVKLSPSNNVSYTPFVGVSDNAFTDAEKAKLAGIEEGATAGGSLTFYSTTEADTGLKDENGSNIYCQTFIFDQNTATASSNTPYHYFQLLDFVTNSKQVKSIDFYQELYDDTFGRTQVFTSSASLRKGTDNNVPELSANHYNFIFTYSDVNDLLSVRVTFYYTKN